MNRRWIIAALAFVLGPAAFAQSRHLPMDDQALDSITAAGVSASVSDNTLHFLGQTMTGNGLVEAAGTLSLQNTQSRGTSGSLLISGNAQSNLQAFININAVNSNINVLLNLTVNINSNVGNLVQSNLPAGRP